MKTLSSATLIATLLTAATVWGEASGDRPDARHAWAVHDVNRPDPVKIEALPGKPPSDAIVLFDGTAESVTKNWRASNGGPSKWTVKDGLFVCVPSSGPAVTAEKFADCQLHVEWLSPVGDTIGLGNSGVIFMGIYEIQILDSSSITPSKSPWKEANYADGQAGAVYGQNPPLVNPARKPGEWQSYDIIFHPPLWEGDTLIDPGSVTVFFNGVLVQDAWPFEAGTTWCRRLTRVKHAPEAPLYLQDHGNPVPFRNIWIRRIPSRFANTTCGGPGVKESDVAALRAKLAKESLAAAEEATEPDEKLVRLWEAYGYTPDAAIKARAQAASLAYAKMIDGWDAAACAKARNRLAALQRFANMLIRQGFIPADSAFAKSVNAACARR